MIKEIIYEKREKILTGRDALEYLRTGKVPKKSEPETLKEKENGNKEIAGNSEMVQ